MKMQVFALYDLIFYIVLNIFGTELDDNELHWILRHVKLMKYHHESFLIIQQRRVRRRTL